MIHDTDVILRPFHWKVDGGRAMIAMSVVAAALLIAILVGALASM